MWGSSPLARGLRATEGRAWRIDGIIPARAGFTSAFSATPGSASDHPRSRGVYPGRPRGPTHVHGSSPLARGLRVVLDPLVDGVGIIPARAGFTWRSPARSATADHPRSRGVYMMCDNEMTNGVGSSPLARGLRQQVLPRPRRDGIIPARAGFTCARPTARDTRWDHPRSRGVYPIARRPNLTASGSSPLARGLLEPSGRLRNAPGIIPARAGFTPTPMRRRLWSRDHPRSRGVYPPIRPTSLLMCGSSPLARGLPAAERGCQPHEGIIPARAGFTRGARDDQHVPQDHPRSRGVYTGWRGLSFAPRGSSPLARGLLVRGWGYYVRRRIIPARAGFTSREWRADGWGRDHPRSRGVYTRVPVTALCGNGSSPLARGLLKSIPGAGAENRIIPARAGFTKRVSAPR